MTRRPARSPISLCLKGVVPAAIVLALGLIGPAVTPARSAPLPDPGAQVAPARFESGPCPELALRVVPAIRTARCGFLVVPENRTKDNGRTIRLQVAIVPALSPTPAPDPFVYLAGGPGDIAIGAAPLLVEAGVNRDRDLILMNQRGTLFSEPALTCPQIDRFNARRVGLAWDAASTGRLHVAATRSCRRRLAAQGIDLAAYNTTESAADVADLRTALGIGEWNLYGVSYGSDLALTIMREHPQGVRSVTLDSVVPPWAASLGGLWANAREGFDNLFRACAAQPACRRRHPDLARTFTDLVRRLESRPLATRVRPAGGAPVEVVLDGGALVNWLVREALRNTRLARVPAQIGALAAGHPQDIAEAVVGSGGGPGGLVGYNLIYGVFCSEWVPFERPSEVLRLGRRAFPGYPASVLAQAPQLPFLAGDCHVWNVPRAPAAQRAVTRITIPTLLLSGSFDAVTPPSQARIAARALPDSTLVTVPGVGHDVLRASPCAQRVLASFLATPSAPDTGCVMRLRVPPFAGPGGAASRKTGRRPAGADHAEGRVR